MGSRYREKANNGKSFVVHSEKWLSMVEDQKWMAVCRSNVSSRMDSTLVRHATRGGRMSGRPWVFVIFASSTRSSDPFEDQTNRDCHCSSQARCPNWKRILTTPTEFSLFDLIQCYFQKIFWSNPFQEIYICTIMILGSSGIQRVLNCFR